jgi:hypothetical protein
MKLLLESRDDHRTGENIFQIFNREEINIQNVQIAKKKTAKGDPINCANEMIQMSSKYMKQYLTFYS